MLLNSSTAAGAKVLLFRSDPNVIDIQATAIEQALECNGSVNRHERFDKMMTPLVTPPNWAYQDEALYVEAGTMGFILSAMQNDELKARDCLGNIKTLASVIQLTR